MSEAGIHGTPPQSDADGQEVRVVFPDVEKLSDLPAAVVCGQYPIPAIRLDEMKMTFPTSPSRHGRRQQSWSVCGALGTTFRRFANFF